MADLFIRMLLGHLVGDYLLQTERMALQKSAHGLRGWAWCLWHCSLYTAAICCFSWNASPMFIALIFLSHFPIDRWSLADVWLKRIGGRSILAAHAEAHPHREVRIAFACLVYAVADNTMHLVLLWLIALFVT